MKIVKNILILVIILIVAHLLAKLIGTQLALQHNEQSRHKTVTPIGRKKNTANPALEELLQKAQNGDAKAQADLGTSYQMGVGVKQDYEKAFYWLNKAAEQGFTMAYAILGQMYTLGQGVEQNDLKAAEYMAKAAEDGLAQAELMLGVMYLAGQGVPRDDTQGLQLITSSAKKGYAPAQHALAGMYNEGIGVQKSRDDAFEWYSLSAHQGWPYSQVLLAFMYAENGDYVESLKWNLLAEKNGQDLAFEISLLRKSLSSTQIQEAQSRADKFVAKPSSVPFTADTLRGFRLNNL
ncbi:hypothetical protein DRO91_07815 [Candidatus Heimdallarchaeota archaeon]|nr:MAG: hypothetical protein DRO91_07815 [Candidatus Heimdallarchaeota archaeon]